MFTFLGLTVGVVTTETETPGKIQALQRDITYITGAAVLAGPGPEACRAGCLAGSGAVRCGGVGWGVMAGYLLAWAANTCCHLCCWHSGPPPASQHLALAFTYPPLLHCRLLHTLTDAAAPVISTRPPAAQHLAFTYLWDNTTDMPANIVSMQPSRCLALRLAAA